MAVGKKYEAAKQQVEQRPYTVPDAMGLLPVRAGSSFLFLVTTSTRIIE